MFSCVINFCAQLLCEKKKIMITKIKNLLCNQLIISNNNNLIVVEKRHPTDTQIEDIEQQQLI